MANYSEVIHGQMILRGPWTAKMIKDLNISAAWWRMTDYGTYFNGSFEKVNEPVIFTAEGYWNYGNNLREIETFIRIRGDNKVKKAHKDLCASLLTSTWIDVTFKEHEPGYQILRDCYAKIGLENNALFGYIIATKDYAYNPENLVELGFYDDIEEVMNELYRDEP